MQAHDVNRRVLRAQLDETLAKMCILDGHDPARLQEAINDWFTTEDRVEFVPMRTLLAEEVAAVEPEVGVIEGRDTGLFYRGAVNLVWGTDGCGKTLLLQKIIMQELEAGNEVMYLDAEEGSPRNMRLRLQEMGIDPEWGDRLHYVNLDRPPTPETRAMFVDKAKDCSLVAIDSAGEFMGMYGKDSSKDLETRSILFEMFGRPLAKTGAAVVILDHISKSSDGSQPIGSIRKRAGVDGAAYNMMVDEGNEWSKTRGGYANLICQKDRNGTYARSEHVARIQVFPAATSPDGLLVVEMSWTEFDDIMDDEMIDVDAPPPAVSGKPDLDALIIELIGSSAGPLTPAYLLTLLKPKGYELTKVALETILKGLQQGGWLVVGKGGWRTAPLHSV